MHYWAALFLAAWARRQAKKSATVKLPNPSRSARVWVATVEAGTGAEMLLPVEPEARPEQAAPDKARHSTWDTAPRRNRWSTQERTRSPVPKPKRSRIEIRPAGRIPPLPPA